MPDLRAEQRITRFGDRAGYRIVRHARGHQRPEPSRRGGRPTPADLAARDTVAKVAGELGATPAQVGLAWVLDRARRSATALVPITSAPTAADLTENLQAVDLVLSTEDTERLDSAAGFSLGEPHVHNLEAEAYVTSADLIRPAIPAA
ncbi:aldo/keto reductase [Amycolatopsis pigmentata]|uniref:Aldo/keto reductase n=1 Tax=Amycolatopsis pigmentata TaxID=450801 RepID=A0ABW5G3S2_9PSEU